MQNFKYALFWILFLACGAVLFWQVPMNSVGAPILVIIPIGLIAWLAARSDTKQSSLKLPPDLQGRFKKSFRQAPHDLQAHSELLRLCIGDTDAVERLIQFELQKSPSLTRAQATRAARDRLAYERGRTC